MTRHLLTRSGRVLTRPEDPQQKTAASPKADASSAGSDLSPLNFDTEKSPLLEEFRSRQKHTKRPQSAMQIRSERQRAPGDPSKKPRYVSPYSQKAMNPPPIAPKNPSEPALVISDTPLGNRYTGLRREQHKKIINELMLSLESTLPTTTKYFSALGQQTNPATQESAQQARPDAPNPSTTALVSSALAQGKKLSRPQSALRTRQTPPSPPAQIASSALAERAPTEQHPPAPQRTRPPSAMPGRRPQKPEAAVNTKGTIPCIQDENCVAQKLQPSLLSQTPTPTNQYSGYRLTRLK